MQKQCNTKMLKENAEARKLQEKHRNHVVSHTRLKTQVWLNT